MALSAKAIFSFPSIKILTDSISVNSTSVLTVEYTILLSSSAPNLISLINSSGK